MLSLHDFLESHSVLIIIASMSDLRQAVRIFINVLTTTGESILPSCHVSDASDIVIRELKALQVMAKSHTLKTFNTAFVLSASYPWWNT